MVVAIVRRLVFKPARYAVPEKYGKAHKADAIFLLALIAILMVADSLFAASQAAGQAQQGQPVEYMAALSLPWVLKTRSASHAVARSGNSNLAPIFVHELRSTSCSAIGPLAFSSTWRRRYSVSYFAKLDRGTIKPVRWGVTDEHLDQVKSFGVKTFEDFTWKHMLDFYSCADCGRCSDQCPANAVGQAAIAAVPHHQGARLQLTSTIRFSEASNNGTPLIGSIYSEDEIWSCTTCGACEAECPLLVEYIDKIVDLRRGMVDDGKVPQSLQKPLKALESRGNPFGKMEKKKADWAKPRSSGKLPGKNLNGKHGADTLYFVDSITSYDERMQSIGRATARILDHAGENFGILGAAEKDSGHEVRRFGEETLFLALRDHNADAIRASGRAADRHRRPARLQRAEARL